jgi:ABC transporter substrate binding protein
MRRRELLALVGSAAAWPHALRAQQTAMPVIGYLSDTSAYEPRLAAFRQGLGDTGWVEGRNVAIEYRWAEGRYDQLPAMAGDLVGRKVDVIVATALPSIRAAKNATSMIPITFITGDPVGDGVVASLARPGGNLTPLYPSACPEAGLNRRLAGPGQPVESHPLTPVLGAPGGDACLGGLAAKHVRWGVALRAPVQGMTRVAAARG